MALNDVDAALESFKKALALEPNDGLSCFSVIVVIEIEEPISLFVSFFLFWNNDN